MRDPQPTAEVRGDADVASGCVDLYGLARFQGHISVQDDLQISPAFLSGQGGRALLGDGTEKFSEFAFIPSGVASCPPNSLPLQRSRNEHLLEPGRPDVGSHPGQPAWRRGIIVEEIRSWPQLQGPFVSENHQVRKMAAS